MSRRETRMVASIPALGSIKILPGRRSVEQPNTRRTQCSGFEVSCVDAHPAVFLGLDAFPVGDAAARSAPDELERPVAPDVLLRRSGGAEDPDLGSFVIRP